MMTPDQAPTMKNAVCPVCHMLVNVVDSTPKIDHGPHAHFFCSEECKQEFEKDPKKYH